MSALRTISAGIAFFLGPILGAFIQYYISYEVLMFIITALFLVCGVVELIEAIKANWKPSL